MTTDKIAFIIEDDEKEQALMRDILEPLGFEVVSAHSPAEFDTQLGELQAQGKTPSLMVFDWHLSDRTRERTGSDLAPIARKAFPSAAIIMRSTTVDAFNGCIKIFSADNGAPFVALPKRRGIQVGIPAVREAAIRLKEEFGGQIEWRDKNLSVRMIQKQ